MSLKLYAADGVNVAEEATFSSYAGSICKGSYGNSPFVKVHDLSHGHFRGPRPVTFQNLPPEYIIESSADGLGTKGILIDAAGIHETAGYDLVAMTATDITRYGGLPLVLINILDLVSVGKEGDEANATYKKLLTGLGAAAKASNVVVLKGETAQMSVCIGSEIKDSPTRFNWGATMTGVYMKEKMVTGDTLAAGQKVIALKEQGFRCNGISSVRKAFAMHYGPEWWKNADAQADMKAAAAPSLLYDVFVNTLHGWYAPDFKAEMPLHAIVHLSGGGIIEKFGKDLLVARGLGAVLDTLCDPAPIMKKCAEWRGIHGEEFYETWNAGQGMLLVVDEKDADRCVARAKDFHIEAQVCGEIVSPQGGNTLTIVSKLFNTTIIT
jgi:phosphoribosylformylglycinamidine cyclo-ligase